MNASALPDLFSIVGTLVIVGPSESDGGDTTYQHLVFREKGGRVRHLTIVRASADIAALIEQYVIGIFLFRELPGERRLWCVDRADGPRCMDFEAMRAHILK